MLIKEPQFEGRRDRNIIRTKVGDGPTNYMHDKDPIKRYESKEKNTMQTRKYFSTGSIKK